MAFCSKRDCKLIPHQVCNQITRQSQALGVLWHINSNRTANTSEITGDDAANRSYKVVPNAIIAGAPGNDELMHVRLSSDGKSRSIVERRIPPRSLNLGFSTWTWQQLRVFIQIMTIAFTAWRLMILPIINRLLIRVLDNYRRLI